MLWFVKDELI